MVKKAVKRVVKKNTKGKSSGSQGNGKGKGKVAVSKVMSESAAVGEGPVDMVKVRESIGSLVGHSAEEMVTNAIAVVKNGQVAPMKFLFELVGLYPEAEEPKGSEDSLAYALLKRIGLPIESAVEDKPQAGGAASEHGEGNSGEGAGQARGS